MAEFGAHLTSVADHTRPSLFEVLAQESLTATLRPALSHLLKFVAEKNPANFGWCFRYGDEIYILLDLILQNHFLAHQNGSFSESFYSMKRVSLTGKGDLCLSKAEYIKSLTFLVIVPYIKLKLDKLFARWKEASLSGNTSTNGAVDKLQTVYRRIYPFIHMAWEGSFLVYQMRYLFHATNVHSPYMHLAGLRLIYQSPEDLQVTPVLTESNTHLLSMQSRIRSTLKKVLGLVAIGLSQGLSVGVFFLQFLEWWYMYGDQQTHLAFSSLPIPPPPSDKIQDEIHKLLPEDKTRCPICQRNRTNDATLSTSGFVFCYPCVYTYIKNHRCCPITKYPTSLDQVIKLYPPSD